MQKIKKHAPQIFSWKFWFHATIVSLVFILLPIGLKALVHGSYEEAKATEICSYKVSRSGNIHAITSPYYRNVNFKTGLFLDEAQSIAKILQ
jgi:hypothetical protein